MLEREMKFLLEKEQFYMLLEQIQKGYPDTKPKEIYQTNYYYDTKDLQLFKQNITLRVRRKNGKYVIEKKELQGYDGQIRKAIESKYPVANLPKTINAADAELDGDYTFYLLGQLETNRTRFTLPDGTNIDFDVSKYFDETDYEVEIELGESPPKLLIPSPCNRTSKLERFIGRLK